MALSSTPWQALWNRLPAPLQNRYYLTLVVFLFIMVFLDSLEAKHFSGKQTRDLVVARCFIHPGFIGDIHADQLCRHGAGRPGRAAPSRRRRAHQRRPMGLL